MMPNSNSSKPDIYMPRFMPGEDEVHEISWIFSKKSHYMQVFLLDFPGWLNEAKQSLYYRLYVIAYKPLTSIAERN